MADDERALMRIEAQVSNIQERITKAEMEQGRHEERLINHKDRIEKIESTQRNIVMTIIAIIITAAMKTLGLSK
jgi:hypothetical protein